MGDESNRVFGRARGRKVAFSGNAEVHKSNWLPSRHPGKSQIPSLLYPRHVTAEENRAIREIWAASDYRGRDFDPLPIDKVPPKPVLSNLLVCGLKAACATYSQHWQGMYFDWTFNDALRDIMGFGFPIKLGGEHFAANAFATVVLINTGYKSVFMEALKMRQQPLPHSMTSLEMVDMGTFEHNLRCAVCAVLGGEFGVNVIRKSLARDLIDGPNKVGYKALRELTFIEGMDPDGKICTVLQLGLKPENARLSFDPRLMRLAEAKLIERKSERRNPDFSRDIPKDVYDRFFEGFNRCVEALGATGAVKWIVLDGTKDDDKKRIEAIRDRINAGIDKAAQQMLDNHKVNLEQKLTEMDDPDAYAMTVNFIAETARKVLKPQEDGHRMIFFYVDLAELRHRGIPLDVAEQAIGEGVQAGLNSIHLDGTTDVPEDCDMQYGAFAMTGPIHSAELNDTAEQAARGWGHGFWDVLAPGLPGTNKMEVVVSLSCKHETDAMIAEKQAMEERKSVNDIFWYRTWNHVNGKQLDLPHWVSCADVLHVAPIPGNETTGGGG